ncbi:hypothetical protein ACFL45_00125 [Candidatus Neomarinimicrobiota bacterium]
MTSNILRMCWVDKESGECSYERLTDELVKIGHHWENRLRLHRPSIYHTIHASSPHQAV